MQKVLCAVVVTFSFTAGACAAEPIVLNCKFAEGSKGGAFASAVNSVAIDASVPSIEFRAAQTVRTNNPINYTFDNRRADAVNPLGDVLVVQVQKDAIVAGGVRFGTPFAIRLDRQTNTVIWQYIDRNIPEYSRFECHR